MPPDPKAQAALALHRFGLGPRPGSIAAIASDPRGALLAELDKPNAGRIEPARLMHRARKATEKAAEAKGEGMSPEMTQAENAATAIAPAQEAKPGQPKQTPPLE